MVWARACPKSRSAFHGCSVSENRWQVVEKERAGQGGKAWKRGPQMRPWCATRCTETCEWDGFGKLSCDLVTSGRFGQIAQVHPRTSRFAKKRANPQVYHFMPSIVDLGIYPFVCLSIYLSVCRPECLPICLVNGSSVIDHHHHHIHHPSSIIGITIICHGLLTIWFGHNHGIFHMASVRQKP
jgi:hypothetical protein